MYTLVKSYIIRYLQQTRGDACQVSRIACEGMRGLPTPPLTAKIGDPITRLLYLNAVTSYTYSTHHSIISILPHDTLISQTKQAILGSIFVALRWVAHKSIVCNVLSIMAERVFCCLYAMMACNLLKTNHIQARCVGHE